MSWAIHQRFCAWQGCNGARARWPRQQVPEHFLILSRIIFVSVITTPPCAGAGTVEGLNMGQCFAPVANQPQLSGCAADASLHCLLDFCRPVAVDDARSGLIAFANPGAMQPFQPSRAPLFDNCPHPRARQGRTRSATRAVRRPAHLQRPQRQVPALQRLQGPPAQLHRSPAGQGSTCCCCTLIAEPTMASRTALEVKHPSRRRR